MRNEYGLTEKEEVFCHEYIANDGNPIIAAQRAGYADDKSNMIRIVAAIKLTDPKIIRRIKNIREDSTLKDKVTIEWTISHFMEIVNRCTEEKTTSESRFNPQGAIRALTEIIKIMGWKEANFKDKPKYASDEEHLADLRRRRNELERRAVGRFLDEKLGDKSVEFSTEEKAVLVENIIHSQEEAAIKASEEIVEKAILEKNTTFS